MPSTRWNAARSSAPSSSSDPPRLLLVLVRSDARRSADPPVVLVAWWQPARRLERRAGVRIVVVGAVALAVVALTGSATAIPAASTAPLACSEFIGADGPP